MRVQVTIPVFNEEAQLAHSIEALQDFLKPHAAFQYEIAIADNGSTDKTPGIADALAASQSEVSVVHLPLKGRGRALRRVWSEANADILTYMDVDLSADLRSFALLIGGLASGNFDLAVGTRLGPGSHTRRGWKREILSRGYNRLVQWLFAPDFSDAQCGFKAITREAARQLLPCVQDEGWFFDTELLLIAARAGYRIQSVPITWTDDTDSRVKIIPTVWGQLMGLARVHRNMRRGAYDDLAPDQPTAVTSRAP